MIKSRFYLLLKKSEKITKTDMLYLTKGGFWLSIGQMITFASLIILSISFANFVPATVYGTYKYVLALAGILSIFTLPGMTTAVARAITRGDGSTIHSALKLRIIWSIPGALIGLSAAAYYFYKDNLTLSIALAIIAITLPFFDTFTLYNAHLTGTRNFKKQSLFHLVSQSVSILSLLITLLLTDNVLWLIAAYFVPLTIVRMVLYRISVPKQNEGTDNETLTYGKHLSLINVLGVIASNIDTLMLWQFLGPQKVAIYTFALAIPEQIKGPLKGISELAFPKFAIQSSEHPFLL
jgi:O-antigen/teichoic acid export membrane protein